MSAEHYDPAATEARYDSLAERPVAPISKPFEITPLWEEKRREVGAAGKSVDEMLTTGLCEVCHNGGFVGFWRGDVWAVDGTGGKLVRCTCRAGERVRRADAGIES